jgi:hypothetical protein
MSLSIADTFAIGIVATVLAFGFALVMRELPLRTTHSDVTAEPVRDQRPDGVRDPQPALRHSPATD